MKRFKGNQTLLYSASLGVVVFLLSALSLYLSPQFVSELEAKAWDFRVRLVANNAEADPRIKLIVIDQASLDFFEREYGLTWPLPREIYSHVIEFLELAGARGIAFDLLFTEASALSVESDLLLAKAARRKMPVISASVLQESKNLSQEAARKEISDKLSAKAALGSTQLPNELLRPFSSIVLPYPELFKSSKAIGSVQAEPDSDGIFRHYRIGGSVFDQVVLSLPFALLHTVRPEALRTLLSVAPFDSEGRLIVRLHGGGKTYERVSLAEIVQALAQARAGKAPEVLVEKFANSWVFLGATAPGLLDLRPTSLEKQGSGVDFLAAVLDNALHGKFVQKVYFLKALVFVGLAIIVLSAATLLGTKVFSKVAMSAVVLIVFCALCTWFAAQGIWLPMVVPIAAMIVIALGNFAIQYQVEGKRHRFIKDAFRHYVSPSVIEQLVADPSLLSLGGEKLEVSIFFSDIQGFTAASERVEAGHLVEFLNEYLSAVAEIIISSGGTVDKYVGDAVVAFWNAPLRIEDHAERAVRAAVACQQRLAELAPDFENRFGINPATRIGVHTAVVNVGNFGSKTRFNYTVIGDGANTASRLEGANKEFGTRVLVSDATYKKASHSGVFRSIGQVQVVGKQESVMVYEPQVRGNDEIFALENLKRYEAARELFDAGNWSEARELFLAFPNDSVSNRYMERIQQEAAVGVFNPVWVLGGK